MIVPRLKGGLGNQMFTIAAAYAAAKRVESEMYINYNIQHVCGQGSNPVKYKDTLFSNIKNTEVVPENTFSEPDWSYSPIPNTDNVLLDGYFQSEKHFKEYSQDIKNLFYFSEEIKTKITNAISRIPKKIIGMHVRLGDYLHPTYASTHLVCKRDYYVEALKQFDLNDYTVIVCTDSVNLYNKYINIENVIICNSKNELEDLYLLSQCDANIITNSTFSWWGTYLGKEKEKICAPSRWFGVDGPKQQADIYLDNWTIIPV